MYYEWERQNVHIKFGSENMKGRDHWEDLSVDGKVMSECM